ncbi:MAG TPA: hypothetical protein VL131_10270 [Gammaproteobacteria bacterium]|jgi:hypothetical protein|nr:hypothetical protein [Gammaproteobacteria bacterium]
MLKRCGWILMFCIVLATQYACVPLAAGAVGGAVGAGVVEHEKNKDKD